MVLKTKNSATLIVERYFLGGFVMANNKETLQEALMKLAEGLHEASTVYSGTEKGQLLEDIINSTVGDGFTQEKYCNLFRNSFDDEGCLMHHFVEDYIQEHIDETFEWETVEFTYIKSSNNEYQQLIIGLDTAVEGLEEVLEICKQQKEWKNELKHYKNDTEYTPFKTYGFSVFLKKLKGFRKAYIAELTRQVGKRPLKKILEEMI